MALFMGPSQAVEKKYNPICMLTHVTKDLLKNAAIE